MFPDALATPGAAAAALAAAGGSTEAAVDRLAAAGGALRASGGGGGGSGWFVHPAPPLPPPPTALPPTPAGAPPPIPPSGRASPPTPPAAEEGARAEEGTAGEPVGNPPVAWIPPPLAFGDAAAAAADAATAQQGRLGGEEAACGEAAAAGPSSRPRPSQQRGRRARADPLSSPSSRALRRWPPPQDGTPLLAAGLRGPLLGRVRRGTHKTVTLLAVGALRAQKGWFNSGYIFPDGFAALTSFRSSANPAATVGHTCRIIGLGGAYWPAPTFVIVAGDRPDEPLAARSATAAWGAVLARVRLAVELHAASAAAAAGVSVESLAHPTTCTGALRVVRGVAPTRPPKTVIPGPEYFGLAHPAISPAVEALDPARTCTSYWAGKAARAGLLAGGAGEAPAGPSRAPRLDGLSRRPRAGSKKRRHAGGGGEEAAGAAHPPPPLLAAGGPPPRRPPARRPRPRPFGPAVAGPGDDGGAGPPSAAAPRAPGMPSAWSPLERGDRRARRAARAEGLAALGAGSEPAPAPAPAPPPAAAPAAMAVPAALTPGGAPPPPPPAPPLPLLPPTALDPVTLDPLVDPATCPCGHVMGLATWRAVLAETGKCPFSGRGMRGRDVTVLTAGNIGRWRERLVVTE